jgi:SAM-dependent methyltransferase
MMPSLPPAYFDALYDAKPDPWDFVTSPYEAEKYAATLAALPRPRYASALEVGCSVGVLTEALARRCDAVLAIDVADAALAQARARNQAHHHAQFHRAQFPAEMPADLPTGGFDLILLSEVLYYLDAATIVDAALTTLAIAQPDADIMLVHWLGPTPDYPLNGDQAAEMFMGALWPDATPVAQTRESAYRIDLLRRRARY